MNKRDHKHFGISLFCWVMVYIRNSFLIYECMQIETEMGGGITNLSYLIVHFYVIHNSIYNCNFLFFSLFHFLSAFFTRSLLFGYAMSFMNLHPIMEALQWVFSLLISGDELRQRHVEETTKAFQAS